jgi:hypothetical protein
VYQWQSQNRPENDNTIHNNNSNTLYLIKLSYVHFLNIIDGCLERAIYTIAQTENINSCIYLTTWTGMLH